MEKHLFRIFCLSLLLVALFASFSDAQTNTTFQVGVILDADSLVGRIGLTSLSLARSDFYTVNANYSTRLVLHVRDSGGQVTSAAASALNLLKDVEVDAIIGPQTSAQANFVIGLGDAAKVPVISCSATSPALHPQTPYFVQTALSDAAQVDAIVAIVNYFQWHQVVFVYEDTYYGNGIIPYLSNAFQQINARVSYRCVIPLSATDDFILRELYKMKTMQTRVFVVHTSSTLASKFFPKVKEAGMMSEGYAWIITSGLMDLFHSLESRVVDSMQGVLGVKPLIPESKELRSTSLKWKQRFLQNNRSISQTEMSAYGVWAYDTFWALAMAAEGIGFKEAYSLQNTSDDSNSTNMFITGISQTGPKLLAAMLEAKFQGLGGRFRLINGQLGPSSLQIVNVADNRLREVGVWTPSTTSSSFSSERLKGVIWPGESTGAPKGWEIPVSGKKLRVGVPEKAGFPEFVNVQYDPQTNAPKITGNYIDIFESVIAALPYAVRCEYVPLDTRDSYDDLSYQVFNGNFGAAVGDITITLNRSQYVDFTLPIEEGGIARLQKIDYENPNGQNFFLMPFTTELWLTAIALFMFTGLVLWIIEHRLNEAFRGPPSEHVGLIFYIPFIIVSNLARTVVVVWLLVVLILSSSYTASLSARLTAWGLKKSDEEKSLASEGHSVGCREGSFIVSYLKTLGFDDTKIKRYKNPHDFDDALSNGSIKAMFVTTAYSNLFLSNAKYCKKYMKAVSHHSSGSAFVFPRGSPLIADVSRAIIQLTDSGRISEIMSRQIKPCHEDGLELSEYAGKITIKLESFKILFAITGGITATCLVAFLASYLYENRDFVQRISNSGATTWSKIRAMCRHFDQRDPKSFRSSRRGNEDGDLIASPTSNTYADRGSTVVPVSPEQATTENRAVVPVSPEQTTTENRVVVPVSPEQTTAENRAVGPSSDNSTAAAEQAR
ncbi:hypothetical protein ACS0TY_036366 [Phlomoides rotata]